MHGKMAKITSHDDAMRGRVDEEELRSVTERDSLSGIAADARVKYRTYGLVSGLEMGTLALCIISVLPWPDDSNFRGTCQFYQNALYDESAYKLYRKGSYALMAYNSVDIYFLFAFGLPILGSRFRNRPLSEMAAAMTLTYMLLVFLGNTVWNGILLDKWGSVDKSELEGCTKLRMFAILKFTTSLLASFRFLFILCTVWSRRCDTTLCDSAASFCRRLYRRTLSGSRRAAPVDDADDDREMEMSSDPTSSPTRHGVEYDIDDGLDTCRVQYRYSLYWSHGVTMAIFFSGFFGLVIGIV